jgi:hypothetical protein
MSLIAVVVLGGPAAAGVPIPRPPVQFHAEMVGLDCNIMVIDNTTAKIGRSVEWINDESDTHWFQEGTAELWDIQLGGGGTLEGVAAAAGTFSQSCDDGPSYSWSIKLKARSHPASPDFKVRWATYGTRAWWHYDVQFRLGSRSWRMWYSDTRAKAATFDGASGRRYTFRSRVINARTDNTSGWSPGCVVVT